MVDTSTQELAENECWELLRTQQVGRLALIVDERPVIFPVNFAVDQGTIVFRSAEGSKLDTLADRPHVAFEIDGLLDGEAFSVVVTGQGTEIEARDELIDALELPLYPWNPGPKHHFVRIVPESVTGRRFRVADRRELHPDDTPPARARPE